MTALSPVSAGTIDLATTTWCWRQLGDRGEGILSYEASRGRVSLPVRYTATDRGVSIPLDWSDEVGWRAVGAEIRLEVGGRLSAERWWVVRVNGTAERGGRHGTGTLEQARRVHPAHPMSSAASAEQSDRLDLRSLMVRGFVRTLVPL